MDRFDNGHGVTIDVLESYKTIFKPSESDEDLHPLFVKAITNLDRIDYLISMVNGTTEEKILVVMDYGKEIVNYEKIIRTIKSRIA